MGVEERPAGLVESPRRRPITAQPDRVDVRGTTMRLRVLLAGGCCALLAAGFFTAAGGADDPPPAAPPTTDAPTLTDGPTTTDAETTTDATTTTATTATATTKSGVPDIVWGAADDAPKFADDGGESFYGLLKGANLTQSRW